MGQHTVEEHRQPDRMRQFMRNLLTDITALEHMLANDSFERGGKRIGAEQELFLVGNDLRPANLAVEVLEHLGEEFTTELARFNLEVNLDPLEIGTDCLSQLQRQLESRLVEVRAAAAKVDARVLLTGILPTLEKSDLGLDNMTPVPRYYALDEAVRRLRGGPLRCHIKGRDELTVTHDNVMLEACNTSFQVHFQVDSDRFARLYNLAQVATAPVLAASTFSPLLFGRRLWHESRIALFQQAIDTRRAARHRRPYRPRVSFGDRWLDDSVLEIFRDDVARFRLLLVTELGDDPMAAIERGEAPDLKALRLHNGTVYRWNRPCYGITNGLPHLRIENRVLPSGPTVIDEVANAAFWLGLVKGLEQEVRDIRPLMSFGAAHANFLSAARLGLDAQLEWLGKTQPAADLILERLSPLARRGLEELEIGSSDIDLYMGVVEERVESRQTGSRWMLASYNAMAQDAKSRPEALVHLTAAMLEHQERDEPVHTWPLAEWRRSDGWQARYLEVSAFMTTDILTVHADEAVDLAAALMDWRHIRHVPVEDADHNLLGLITHRSLLRYLMGRSPEDAKLPTPARDVMVTDLHTVAPSTSTRDAVTLMRRHGIACLPVVEEGKLVGIVSERDFMGLSAMLLDRFLGEETED